MLLLNKMDMMNHPRNLVLVYGKLQLRKLEQDHVK